MTSDPASSTGGVTRRHAHAAGESWRKWDDPVTYAPAPGPTWSFALSAWMIAIAVGIIAGVLASWL